MADMMTFPDTWEEFEEQYGFADKEQIYTNGSRLIPSFRVKQWLDHLGAVEVVRCGECKYTDGEPPINDGRYWCVLHESFMYYCSDGERRTDEAD